MVQWAFLREFPVSSGYSNLKGKDIAVFIEKLLEFKDKSKKDVCIGNPFPFCAYFPEKVRKLVNYKCSLFNDSLPSDFTIDFEGQLRPCSIIDYKIIDFKRFDSSGFVESNRLFNRFRQKLYKGLPASCKECRYLEKCNSGCRAISDMLYGDFNHLDPLANPEKYLKPVSRSQ
jgi:radical SAM protein with 4Fe4S-binding SPASM domain